MRVVKSTMRCLCQEDVWIEVQVGMPFKIDSGHGREWRQRVCEWHGWTSWNEVAAYFLHSVL